MEMKKIILDTSAYIDFFGGNRKILSALSFAETVYVPAIVLGELYSGFDLTARGVKKRNELAEFLRKPTVEIVPITDETAEFYGKVISDLKRNGTPIPINDVWIAANTFETGSVLVTYDRHFNKIPGLRVWNEALV